MSGPPLHYCQRCGTRLEERAVGQRNRPYCPTCDRPIFEDPKLAVAVVVEIGGKILLQQRAINPGKGAWTFPAGYVDRGEQVEQAAAREVREEVCLEVRIDALIGLYSRAGDTVVVAAYAATALTDDFAVGEEVAAVALYHPAALPTLAFPHDARIVADYLRLHGRG